MARFFCAISRFFRSFSALNASVIRYSAYVLRCCAGTFLPTIVFLWMITPWARAAVSTVTHEPPSDTATTLAHSATTLAYTATTLASLPPRVEIAASSAALAIPEPVSLAVFAMGILLLFRRRRF
jgi:hypothetical protein